MTSLGRIGRILGGTVDVTNSVADKDIYSMNASTNDWNVASTSTDSASDRKLKSYANSSSNINDSNTSSNDNTSNKTMILQGKFNFYQFS